MEVFPENTNIVLEFATSPLAFTQGHKCDIRSASLRSQSRCLLCRRTTCRAPQALPRESRLSRSSTYTRVDLRSLQLNRKQYFILHGANTLLAWRST